MKWYHIKFIVRGIKQKKFNSIIKILGIMLALVPAMLIGSFVKHESSYDKQLPGSEKIYRVIRNWQEAPKYGVSVPVPLLPAMCNEFPEIKTGTRLYAFYDMEVSTDNRIYREDVMLAADSSFFNTFNLDLLAGNKNTVLSNTNSVVISKSYAEKLFGSEDPLGREIKFIGNGVSNNTLLFRVGGVFKDFPSTSHLHGNVIFPLKAFGIYNQTNQTNHLLTVYLQLKSPDDKKSVEQKFPKFMESFYGKDYYDYARTNYLLQPVSDIHLNTTVNYIEYETPKGSYANLYIFPALALLIILIASFNFVNLTVSEGVSKNKAFGINKISGAGRFYFYAVYILESLLLNAIALIISLLLLRIISPEFKTFVNRDIDLSFLASPYWIGGALIFMVLIGLINGIYPAILYSTKSSIGYLKDKANSLVRQTNIQRFFQVSQFAICIFFIAGSIVVFKQLNYIHTTINRTLDKDNVLIIKNADKLGNNRSVFKSELKKMGGVSDVSLCDEIPGIAFYSHWGQPVDSAAFNAHVAVYNCDEDYLSTLRMQLVKGRFFDPEIPTDNRGIILNETAVKTLGWEADPIGKRYRFNDTFQVVGVVKDIYFNSFHREMLPQGFLLTHSGDRFLVKFTSGQTLESIQDVQDLWSEFVPEHEMHYSFLDDEFDFWYQSERKTGQLAIILAAIAIFLSGLGLLALVLQSINSRIKEIGIRKVNGAKVFEIIRLINSTTVLWVLIAFVLITPVSWWVLNKWLQGFFYHTTVSWWIFGVAGLVTLIIALFTVSFQSWRAATRNPVEALRYE
ncbi:MAG: ABC transporter permease [Prolixibacteraceae bacterium]|nr:ABC transporter permease [Prolixibacteraceae bacterium]MBN2773462.1 ABC transporter permease [Prolixibacteraceae bacterium]